MCMLRTGLTYCPVAMKHIVLLLWRPLYVKFHGYYCVCKVLFKIVASRFQGLSNVELCVLNHSIIQLERWWWWNDSALYLDVTLYPWQQETKLVVLYMSLNIDAKLCMHTLCGSATLIVLENYSTLTKCLLSL